MEDLDGERDLTLNKTASQKPAVSKRSSFGKSNFANKTQTFQIGSFGSLPAIHSSPKEHIDESANEDACDDKDFFGI